VADLVDSQAGPLIDVHSAGVQGVHPKVEIVRHPHCELDVLTEAQSAVFRLCAQTLKRRMPNGTCARPACTGGLRCWNELCLRSPKWLIQPVVCVRPGICHSNDDS